MKRLRFAKIRLILIAAFVVTPALTQIVIAANGTQPVADAGLSRYAANEPVMLDGTGSYDPDESGLLSYTWQQVSGPLVTITNANTATPTISNFVQTEEIQECEFELLVSDGELTSLPDIAKVIIVPAYPLSRVPELRNEFFDPDKPTIVCFRGGDGTYGAPEGNPFRLATDPLWLSNANIISFRAGYEPDSIAAPRRTYYRCGDMIIVYLSSVAPNYKQAIQSIGHSTGGLPAMDVGLHLNLTYKDSRYAVNRVTLLDVGNLYWRDPGSEDMTINQFLASSVDGEQCWIDDYWWGELHVFSNILNVQFPVIGHAEVRYWYSASLTDDNKNTFNNGVVAGAYWSVIGPGKNLQLESTGDYTYVFKWPGGLHQEEPIEMYDESSYPGRLPEPVTLVGPRNGAFVNTNGAIFSCEISENSIGYQLIFGQDPYYMTYLVSDTPNPPSDTITTFPFEQIWWTVKAYDQYGSTIYADPLCIIAENVVLQTIENITTSRKCSSIQQAINDAIDDQEIVISPGICQYYENIDFKGKSLTLRSIDPNDPNIVANTIISGSNRGPTIQLSSSQNARCLLAGLTITGGTVGISCCDAAPIIQNCTFESHGAIAIDYWDNYVPTIIDCNVLGDNNPLVPWVTTYWKLDETEGAIAYDSAGLNDALVIGEPVWQPDGGIVNGALEFDGINDYVCTPFVLDPGKGPLSVFAWIKGGLPGQTIISQVDGANWLSANLSDGALITELKGGGRTGSILESQTVITDDDWHRIGLTWDGANRILYVDNIVVAIDTQANLLGSEGGLLIGTGNIFATGEYWTGLIDDVRIYDRAITP